MSRAGGGDRGPAGRRPLVYLVVGPGREMGLSETPRPWSFPIPEGVDGIQTLREARDARSALHRLVMLQVAMMAEVESRVSPPAAGGDTRAIMRATLAMGRRRIADAMRRVGTEGHDAKTVAILRAGLAPLTIRLSHWSLLRTRSDGKRRVVGLWAKMGQARWSGPIRSSDRAALAATTGSGTRYELIGDPSDAGLDDHLVRLWLAAHDRSRHDVEIMGVEDL